MFGSTYDFFMWEDNLSEDKKITQIKQVSHLEIAIEVDSENVDKNIRWAISVYQTGQPGVTS